MANDFTALGSAIYSRLGTAGTVSIFWGLAPQGQQPPYVVFDRLATTDAYTFGARSEISTDFSVKVISNRNSPGEAALVYGHIHNAMQDAPLAVTGFTLLRCRRRSTIQYREPDGFWHVGGIYRIDLTEV